MLPLNASYQFSSVPPQLKLRAGRLFNVNVIGILIFILIFVCFFYNWPIAIGLSFLTGLAYFAWLKTQKVLAASNLRFFYAAQATSDAIWDRDCSEDVINWGEGFRTLFGYEINKSTMRVSFWESKVHPDDIRHVCQIIQQAKDDPRVNSWSAEYRFLNASGDYAFVKEKAIILRNEHGRAIKGFGAVQDVTESKQNELMLKKLNESLEKEKYFLDSLMNNMPDCIYFKDRQSRIIRVSRYMAERFGTSVEELIGKTDFDFQDEVHAREAYRDEQEILETGQPKVDYLEQETLKNGALLWVSSTKMPLLNAKREIVGTFGISRDVTNIRMLEQERHEALVDRAVAQGKFEIASDVMHDIGNAVVGFGSYLTRIRRLQSEDSPDTLRNLSIFFEKQQSALSGAVGEAKAQALIKMLDSMAKTQKANQEEINRSILEQQNIITTIQEILNIQRQYIAGHESQERKPVNMQDIINDSIAMISESLDTFGIRVSTNADRSLPLIKGDRTKLMQALLSILRNSMEAMDVTAAAKSIQVGLFMNAGKLTVQVKDSGNGFDEANAGDFFCKGFTTKASASGLGLYNCQKIVESHKGVINISSDGIGKGAVTTMEFAIE